MTGSDKVHFWFASSWSWYRWCIIKGCLRLRGERELMWPGIGGTMVSVSTFLPPKAWRHACGIILLLLFYGHRALDQWPPRLPVLIACLLVCLPAPAVTATFPARISNEPSMSLTGFSAPHGSKTKSCFLDTTKFKWRGGGGGERPVWACRHNLSLCAFTHKNKIHNIWCQRQGLSHVMVVFSHLGDFF